MEQQKTIQMSAGYSFATISYSWKSFNHIFFCLGTIFLRLDCNKRTASSRALQNAERSTQHLTSHLMPTTCYVKGTIDYLPFTDEGTEAQRS